MLQNLSSRLLLAFAFVILLSLALSGGAALFLLRDQQREAAEERFGRLAEPITLAVALLEEANVGEAGIRDAIADYAGSFDVRVLLVTEDGRVAGDTNARLTGRTIDVFRDPDIEVTERGGAEFRMTNFSADGEELLLFAPPREAIPLSSNRLVQLQALIYELYASGVPPDQLQELLSTLPVEAEQPQTIPPPSIRPLVAVSEDEITSAWQELVPQLAIAGAVAVAVSAVVAILIARSVTRPLGRITTAAQEMARGNYDQQLDARGKDEVGRLASSFNVMAREVSTSHQMMRDLLANVSHELKTPLTSIQGFSQAMEEGAIASQEDFQQAGKIINEETQRMRRLVDDLIDLSRLESGQAVVKREPLDLSDLLRTCAGRFEWQLRDAGASLQLDLAPVPAVSGDGLRLEQAFSNLIDNAVRHTNGGTVTVRSEARNGVVRIGVHNTGSYIPPDDLPRLFERFYQLDRHRRRAPEGGSAGLGLAIAHEVVQAHHGTIEAQSDRERGTEFIVTLPLAPSNGERGTGKE